ncbi:MAG: hypothetical protein V3W20_01745, partial [Candidatus Neomarinimicrobiota bacterium]
MTDYIMPGKGHSGRFRSSISNRSDKPAFRVLAPWNSRKNGQKGQVAISQGTDTVKFQNLEAQQMANYNAGNNTFNMNNNFTVAGTTFVAGQTTLNNNVNVSGSITQPVGQITQVGFLEVQNDATYNNNLTVGGNFTVNGTTTTLNTRIIDVSDSIIKVNDVFCDQSGNKSHGILFEYNTEHQPGVTGNFVPANGFFGVQRKIGTDINTHTLDAVNNDGGPGVFTYYTQDISDNSGGALQLADGSFNIPSHLLGDALFKNLDLCGNLTGYNTFQIKNGDSGTDGTIWMRARDLSMNAVNDISMCALNDMYLKGETVDIRANGLVSVGSATSGFLIYGQQSTIQVLGTNQNLTLETTGSGPANRVIVNSAGTGTDAIRLDASGGIDIDANAVDICGNTTCLKLNSSAAVLMTNAILDIDALDVSMVATHDISMCAQNDMLLKVTEKFDVSANAVDICGNNACLKLISSAAVLMTNTILDINALDVSMV